MNDPKELRKLIEAVEPEGYQITYKAMFGGFMVYADGRPVASLSDVGIGLKTSPEERDELLMEHEAGMLQYEPGAPVSKSYVCLPDAMAADPAQLAERLASAAAFVCAAPLKAKRSRRG